MKKYFYMFCVAGFISVFMVFVTRPYKNILPDNADAIANQVNLNFIVPDSALTLQNVYAEIVQHGMQHPVIVLAQACLETGWFKSYNCTRRNNLFGMKGGDSTATNIHGYQIYDTWHQSVSAYQNWPATAYENGDYYDFLVRVKYARSAEYVQKLKNMVKKLLPMVTQVDDFFINKRLKLSQ